VAPLTRPGQGSQLIEHARGKDASKNILDALGSVPDQEHDGPNEVSTARRPAGRGPFGEVWPG
jgi:hypothetical protein